MNKNINLCELLEGHEGESFYSPICGDITLCEINFNLENPIMTNRFNLSQEGKWIEKGEVVIFPSKDQRDWNKWAEEQKIKTIKIWGKNVKLEDIEVWNSIETLDYGSSNPVIKSALALLKIRQLIEVGYGGNPTTKEKYSYNSLACIRAMEDDRNPVGYVVFDETDDITPNDLIAFHTKEQAIEFLSYPDNVQLLNDLYII